MHTSGGQQVRRPAPPASVVLFLAWSGYALLHAVWLVVPGGDVAHRVGINTALVVAASFATTALAWRTARHPALAAADRRPWWWIGAAYLLMGIGNTLWGYAELVVGSRPFPSWADVAYLGVYPLLLVGILRFPVAAQSRQECLTFWLDTATVVVGGGMGVWQVLLRPTALTVYPDALTATLAIAYPVADLVLLFGIATLLLRHAATSRAVLGVLVAGLGCSLIFDVAFGYLALQGQYRNGHPIDAIWVVMVWLVGGSAQLQVWAGTCPASAPRGPTATPIRMRWLPYGAVAFGYGLLLATTLTLPDPAGIRDMVLGAGVLTLLVVGRQVVAVRENSRLLADQARQQSEARFRALAQHSGDVILLVDADGTLQYHTPSAERMFGYPSAELQAVALLDLVHPDDRMAARAFLDLTRARPGVSAPAQWRMRARGGAWHYVETLGNNLLANPLVGGVVLNVRDVGERKQLEAALQHQAFHDALTDLPNRALLLDRLDHALARTRRQHTCLAVLFLDLDNFKVVNDNLGHYRGEYFPSPAAMRHRSANANGTAPVCCA